MDSTVLTIARRQPVASDLRDPIGAIRIAGDLERVGDLTKNIARRSEVGRGDECSSRHHRHQARRGANELPKDVLDDYAQRAPERV
jgi:phosphate transport system protein